MGCKWCGKRIPIVLEMDGADMCSRCDQRWFDNARIFSAVIAIGIGLLVLLLQK